MTGVWHPNTQMAEWDRFHSIERGEGMWLVDANGHRMLDAVASMWCNVWGHSEPELVSALASQAARLQHAPLFNLTHPPAEALAGHVLEVCPGMDGVFYSDNGSTATEAAFKMAVQYWNNQGASERLRIAGLEGGYHGDTLGAMAAGYSDAFFGRYEAMTPRGVTLRMPRPGGGPEEWDACVQDAAATLEEDQTLAALVMESGAQVAGGARIYPDGFQREITRLCRKNDVLVICDEVATGLGRLGAMAEYSRQGAAPDIAAYGKMLTGGYLPLAATLATGRVREAFLGGYDDNMHLFHGHTYTGNPLAAAVACRNLELYAERRLIRRVRRTSKLLEELLAGAGEMDAVAGVSRGGLLAGIRLDWEPPAGRSANHVIYHAGRKNGVYLRTLGSTVLLVPPLAVGGDELAMMVSRVLNTVRDVTLG